MATDWTDGDVSNSATITDNDHLYPGHINELRVEVDARETDLTTHAADTTTHGATGAVVGTTNIQTLTNKTLTSATLTSATLTSPTLTGPVVTDLEINDTSANHQYIFAVSELAADRNVTLPLLTGNDEFVFKAHTQTLTNKTLTSATLTSPVLTTPQIQDTSADHQYIFGVSELTADRTVTLPLLTGNDEFVFKAHTQVFTNKTIIQKVVSYTPSAAATATLDVSTGGIHKITMPAGNITIAISNEAIGQCFMIEILQDGTGSRTVTWFSTIAWAGGSAPTLTTTADKTDTFGFRVTSADNYQGYIIGQNV